MASSPALSSAAASPAVASNYASVLAQKAISQVAGPVPALQPSQQAAMSPLIQPIEPIVLPLEPIESNEPINFVQEVQSMLYTFGDSRRPKLETAILVDDVVRQQMVELLLRAIDASHLRGANGVVGIEDVLFLLRKNPVKVQRFVKYFKVKDMALVSQIVSQQNTGTAPVVNLDNKRAKRCKDFLLSIDCEGGLLTQALNDELQDEVRLNRLRRRDRYTRMIDERKYIEFTRARHISFLGHNMRFAAKFRHWILTGIKATATEDASQAMNDPSSRIKMDRSGLEALAYLAYETVGYIVEMALTVRYDADLSKKSDEVQRSMVPISYNTQYPMVQNPLSGAEDTARRMLTNRKEEDSIWTQPLEPHHILEAVRRLTQRPSSALGWYRRLEQRQKPNPMPIIAI